MSHHSIWKAAYNQDAEVKLTEAGSETFKITKKDAVAAGSSAAAQVQSEKVVLYTEGTPANGLGTYRSYYIEDSAGNEQEMARVACVATTLTDGSESAELQFWTRRAGTLTKILTIDSAATLTSGGTTVAYGLVAKSATAAAITTARTLTSADSGGVFSVAKTSAYAITLPTPAQGLRFKFLVLDTGANIVTFSNGSAHLYGCLSIANVSTSVGPHTTIGSASGAGIGDWVEFEGIDATHYLVTGACVSAGDLTIA